MGNIAQTITNKTMKPDLLVILFTMTLPYMAIANRFDTHFRMLGLQGLLLFGVAFLKLYGHVSVANMGFILVETLVFKAILVPYFLFNIIKKNKIKRDFEVKKLSFYVIFTVLLIIVSSFVFAHQLNDEHLEINFFTASISALLVGVLLIVIRKTIITHIVGYLVLENGIFLFSLALGSEMPMIVNIGILLDLFTSVLLLGVFVNRINEVFHTVEIDTLTELKD